MMGQMAGEAKDLAGRLADELCVMMVSVWTPDWSDSPTAWAGVDRARWDRHQGDQETFRVTTDDEGRLVVVVHGVGHVVADSVAQFPDLVTWVQYASRAYKVTA